MQFLVISVLPNGIQCSPIPIQQVEVVWSKPVDKQTYNTRKTLTKVFGYFKYHCTLGLKYDNTIKFDSWVREKA